MKRRTVLKPTVMGAVTLEQANAVIAALKTSAVKAKKATKKSSLLKEVDGFPNVIKTTSYLINATCDEQLRVCEDETAAGCAIISRMDGEVDHGESITLNKRSYLLLREVLDEFFSEE